MSKPPKKASRARTPDQATSMACARPADWQAWLATHHGSSSGVWRRIAKKGGGGSSLTYAESVDGALAWGWIDSRMQKYDDTAGLQRFTPRKAKSPWSKINRDKSSALIETGKMKAPGLAEVERAHQDGRWKAAYDSARTAVVPENLVKALPANERARACFATLEAANRYAILWRLQAAKKPETQVRRLEKFVGMLARHQSIHALRKVGARRST